MPQADTVRRLCVTDPQHDERDLLGKWQASPAGQVAHDTYALTNLVNDLTALAAIPAGMQALDWEGEDLLAAHRRLGRLLIRVSAHRADQIVR
jgi:hypothetical protein